MVRGVIEANDVRKGEGGVAASVFDNGLAIALIGICVRTCIFWS